jgi:C_GCAxxG_C_C family probable redox protein
VAQVVERLVRDQEAGGSSPLTPTSLLNEKLIANVIDFFIFLHRISVKNKEVTKMETKSEIAVALFNNGFNCSQSVLAVFAEKHGLPQAMALRIASGFGGGMRCGEVCGAASGAIMVIGLKEGQALAEDLAAKSKCNSETVGFMNRFRSQNGSTICREILGFDISTEEGNKKAKNANLFRTTCVSMVASAVQLLEEMGY